MSERKDGGQAFPSEGEGHGSPKYHSPGMSLRDWFASHCPVTMQEAWGIWCDNERLPFMRVIASASERQPFLMFFSALRYEYADAMLAERAK